MRWLIYIIIIIIFISVVDFGIWYHFRDILRKIFCKQSLIKEYELKMISLENRLSEAEYKREIAKSEYEKTRDLVEEAKEELDHKYYETMLAAETEKWNKMQAAEKAVSDIKSEIIGTKAYYEDLLGE